MQPRQLTPQELRQLADLARQWGKIIAGRTAEQHDVLELDFRALEAIAQAAAEGLLQGTLEQLTQTQADALDQLQPCPECGKLCPLKCEPRDLQVQGGTAFRLDEPFAHCPVCRRDFFPPADPPGAGQP